MIYTTSMVIETKIVRDLLEACIAQRALIGGHCPGCQCGGADAVERAIKSVQDRLTATRTLEWSDRSGPVQDDILHIADVIVSCALDHSYDRGAGVPYGDLSMEERDECLTVVERHLSAVSPDWLNRTVELDEGQHAALFADLVAALIRCDIRQRRREKRRAAQYLGE